MTDTQHPTTDQDIEEQAAWGFAERNEPRWPASVAVVAALVLYALLPDRFTLGPWWLIPGVEAVLLVPLTFTWPTRHAEETMLARLVSMGLIAVLSFANIFSLLVLIHLLLTRGGIAGTELLVRSAQIWIVNVLVFALWYWELDRGGPGERMRARHRHPDFLFPQMASPHCTPDAWAPDFVDYAYVAFTNGTAFSPTDTMPLTNWAKLLMMVQSFASLSTVALVAARAVNILQ